MASDGEPESLAQGKSEPESGIDAPQQAHKLYTDGGTTESGSEKSEGIAALASFFIPGIGQWYAGEASRGIGFFIGWIVWQIVAFVLTVVTIGLFGLLWLPGEIVFHLGAAYDAYNQVGSGTDEKEGTTTTSQGGETDQMASGSSGTSSSTETQTTATATDAGTEEPKDSTAATETPTPEAAEAEPATETATGGETAEAEDQEEQSQTSAMNWTDLDSDSE